MDTGIALKPISCAFLTKLIQIISMSDTPEAIKWSIQGIKSGEIVTNASSMTPSSLEANPIRKALLEKIEELKEVRASCDQDIASLEIVLPMFPDPFSPTNILYSTGAPRAC